MFTCDWCGKEFPADPRTMVESGFSMFEEGDADPADAWKGEPQEKPVQGVSFDALTPEQRQEMKESMQLDDAELRRLLETGSVENSVSCVCIECQDAGTEIEP